MLASVCIRKASCPSRTYATIENPMRVMDFSLAVCPGRPFRGWKQPLYIYYNIGIKPIFKDFAKKMKKIVEKVCTYRNYPYLCIRNQEISSYKTNKTVANRKMSNDFEKKLKKSCKKVLEKFGGYKKGYYLCNRFPPQIRAEFFKRFFDLLVI